MTEPQPQLSFLHKWRACSPTNTLCWDGQGQPPTGGFAERDGGVTCPACLAAMRPERRQVDTALRPGETHVERMLRLSAPLEAHAARYTELCMLYGREAVHAMQDEIAARRREGRL